MKKNNVEALKVGTEHLIEKRAFESVTRTRRDFTTKNVKNILRRIIKYAMCFDSNRLQDGRM